jgi:tetratricopeptide (TPR) repeat protein
MKRTAKHQPRPLIDSPKAPWLCGETTDPCLKPLFSQSDRNVLTPDSHNQVKEFKTYLAHAIKKEPMRLWLHIKRIRLHAQTADPAILGALCDLFLVLGDKGLALRRRMLTLAKPLLSTIHYQILQQQLKVNGCATSPLHTLCAGAVLSEGIAGTTQLISKQVYKIEVIEDPLEAARELLECGQTSLAQKMLEWALLNNPERLELHLALLNLYQHTRDREQAECFWQKLRGLSNSAAAEWLRLLKQLEEAETPNAPSAIVASRQSSLFGRLLDNIRRAPPS